MIDDGTTYARTHSIHPPATLAGPRWRYHCPVVAHDDPAFGTDSALLLRPPCHRIGSTLQPPNGANSHLPRPVFRGHQFTANPACTRWLLPLEALVRVYSHDRIDGRRPIEELFDTFLHEVAHHLEYTEPFTFGSRACRRVPGLMHSKLFWRILSELKWRWAELKTQQTT